MMAEIKTVSGNSDFEGVIADVMPGVTEVP